MELAVLLPIAAFIALAAGLAVVLRGTGRIVERTRELEQFRGFRPRSRRSGRRVARRRRPARSTPSGGGRSARTRIVDTIDGRHGRGRSLRRRGQGPPRTAQGADRSGQDLVAELERARRALEMVEHGTSMMLMARRGPRELEAQTSIKRGYLNLIHAREAFARHALEAQDLETDETAAKAGPWSA